jgi:hypothetical protein
MSVFGKFLLLAALAGTALLTFASQTSATTTAIKAKISFERAIVAIKHSDVTFGEMSPRQDDRISLDTEGNMSIDGKGDVVSTGRPSVIMIGDAREQIMNFVPSNYTFGSGIGALRAHCSFNHTLRGDCTQSPIFGKQENALYIGMDMTISDGLTLGDDGKKPSFDMSIVYQ